MLISQILKKLRRYLQITLQNQFNSQSYVSSSLFTSTCTLSQSLSHLDKILWTGSRGSNTMIPGFMWKLSCFWCTMEIEKDLLLAWTRLRYQVKFVNHWSTRKWERLRSELWNGIIKDNVHWTTQVWDKFDMNWLVNYNINLHSFINNTMNIH